MRFAKGKRSLAAELAAAARLDLGVDATPGASDDGWPRIVQDMLDRVTHLVYGDRRLPRHIDAVMEVPSGEREGRFLLMRVASAADAQDGRREPGSPEVE